MTNKPMMLASSGTSQSLEDKLYALKYLISGQGISFVVLKSTTSELIGPKKKHLNYLITMTNEPNVSVPSIVKHLVIRTRHPDWPVVFKCLITMHHLITHGNEKFVQNVSSSVANSKAIESLCTFNDQTTSLAFSMSIFVRRYARYMNIKIQTYRMLGLDFCRVSPQIKMREVSHEQLLKVIPVIQDQFDTLLSFDASLDDLCNGIINSAFSMLYKDFVKLYIVYQAAIIRLLELYFATETPKEANGMLNLYKKFLVRMDKVSDFMPVIDSVGIDKRDMPNLSRVPSFPLKLLEKHVEQLENSNKRIYERSLGRIEYGTLGRTRRRSIKTPVRQTSIDILSPMAVMNYKKRHDELKHLDKMLRPNYDRNYSLNERSMDYDLLGAPDERHEYEELDGASSSKLDHNKSEQVDESGTASNLNTSFDLMLTTDSTNQSTNQDTSSPIHSKYHETTSPRQTLLDECLS